MRCDRARTRSLPFSQARRRSEAADRFSRASEGSGSSKGSAINRDRPSTLGRANTQPVKAIENHLHKAANPCFVETDSQVQETMLRLLGDRRTLLEALTLDWAEGRLDLPRNRRPASSRRTNRFRTRRLGS